MIKRAAAMLVFIASPLWAAEVDVPARPGALVSAIQAAAPGDVLRLAPGVHAGPVVIDRPLVLPGDAGNTTVEGSGEGSVIVVQVPDVTIRSLTIRGSGSSHETRDAGIRLGKKARNSRVVGNHLIGNLYGVDVHGAHDAAVIGNVIEGRRDHRVNDRGNGVYVWNAQGTTIVIASHALTEVEARTDRIAILSKGRLIANDRLGNLRMRAGLPIRIVVTAQDGRTEAVHERLGGRRVNGASVELNCLQDGKLALLASVTDLGDLVSDVQLHDPSLDDIYRHYSGEGLT
ncbi:MAG: hypothetical protein P1U65_13130 [Minwuia sp.]|nr:hypothetical protein [Minwuia sp.]